MKAKIGFFVLPLIALSCAGLVAQAPDLGPGFTKVKDADWHDQNRLGANIDAAYKSVKK